MELSTPQRASIGFEVFSLLVCLGLLTGCSSAGYHKGEAAAVGMQRAAIEVQAEGRAVDQTLASLRNLVNETNGNLRDPFKRYSNSLNRLIASARSTEHTGRMMEQKNAAYLAKWDRELLTIDYQHIRDLSESRRTEVTNRVESITKRYYESQAAVQPLISYLEDIHTALSTDLTVGGIVSLKGIVQNADANGAKVQTALDALTAELTNSSVRMSSVAYQARPPN